MHYTNKNIDNYNINLCIHNSFNSIISCFKMLSDYNEKKGRGKFIVFEGIDGSGKGTQIKKCANFLFDLDKNYDVYLTREPTRDFKKIRDTMNSSERVMENAKWYLEMFVEDRRNHLEKYIIPMLLNGTHVLCDRYKYSTICYQHAQGIALETLIQKNRNMLIPDITFVLDIDAQIAYERRRIESIRDVFERDIEFQKKVRNNYLNLTNILNENIIIIDASKDPERVFETIKCHILSLLT